MSQQIEQNSRTPLARHHRPLCVKTLTKKGSMQRRLNFAALQMGDHTGRVRRRAFTYPREINRLNQTPVICPGVNDIEAGDQNSHRVHVRQKITNLTISSKAGSHKPKLSLQVAVAEDMHKKGENKLTITPSRPKPPAEHSSI